MGLAAYTHFWCNYLFLLSGVSQGTVRVCGSSWTRRPAARVSQGTVLLWSSRACLLGASHGIALRQGRFGPVGHSSCACPRGPHRVSDALILMDFACLACPRGPQGSVGAFIFISSVARRIA